MADCGKTAFCCGFGEAVKILSRGLLLPFSDTSLEGKAGVTAYPRFAKSWL